MSELLQDLFDRYLKGEVDHEVFRNQLVHAQHQLESYLAEWNAAHVAVEAFTRDDAGKIAEIARLRAALGEAAGCFEVDEYGYVSSDMGAPLPQDIARWSALARGEGA